MNSYFVQCNLNRRYDHSKVPNYCAVSTCIRLRTTYSVRWCRRTSSSSVLNLWSLNVCLHQPQTTALTSNRFKYMSTHVLRSWMRDTTCGPAIQAPSIVRNCTHTRRHLTVGTQQWRKCVHLRRMCLNTLMTIAISHIPFALIKLSWWVFASLLMEEDINDMLYHSSRLRWPLMWLLFHQFNGWYVMDVWYGMDSCLSV